MTTNTNQTTDDERIDRWRLYEVAIETWGEDAQMDVLGEECSELSAEVSRFMRGRSDEDNLAEELADVEVMVEQMRTTLDDTVIQKAKVEKLRRLHNRLLEAGADV